MIFDEFQAALDFYGLFDLEWIYAYIIQFFSIAGKCFIAENKNLHILINLSEFFAVDVLTQIWVKDKLIRIVRV